MKSRDHQLNDIKYWLQQHGIHPLVPSNVATTFKRVLKVTDHGIGVLQNWRTCNSYVTLSMIADSMFIVYGPITRLLLHFFVNGKYFESTLYWKCEDLQLTKMDKSTPTHHGVSPTSFAGYVLQINNFLITDPVIPFHIDSVAQVYWLKGVGTCTAV